MAKVSFAAPIWFGWHRASLLSRSVLTRGGSMKLSRVAVVVLAASIFVQPVVGQSQATLLDVVPPVLVDAEQTLIPLDDPLQHAAVPSPPAPIQLARQGERIEPGSPADQYRTVVKTLAVHKHQFVHCKLQNGH